MQKRRVFNSNKTKKQKKTETKMQKRSLLQSDPLVVTPIKLN
jgi:hypothetical protein